MSSPQEQVQRRRLTQSKLPQDLHQICIRVVNQSQAPAPFQECYACPGCQQYQDLFCAGKTATTLGEALSPDFQAALYRWTGDLTATGGSIAAEKLFCYLIDFRWNGSIWKYRKVEELPGEFSIQNKDGVQATLKRYEVSRADKLWGST